MKITVQEIARHRNGISGEPFHVICFTDSTEGPMLGIVFQKPHHVAVLQMEQLAKGNIAFGSNSWRGDQYEPLLRQVIEQWERIEFVTLFAGE
ncbi:MAG: hypothetical protein R3B84_24850 [Zavarzinella sp.]